MPYRILDVDELAEYLHVSRHAVEQLLKTSDLPHQNRGNRVVFLRGEVDAWASKRILGLEAKHLVVYHQKSTQGTRSVFDQDTLIPELMRPEYLNPLLVSKTKRSVIHDMVAMAEATGRVLDPLDLRESVEAREEMCPTALPGGLALLHCRNHDEYRFDGSFLVLGRTSMDIPFSAPDGRGTRIFFLLCCQDERLHLHTLARLCLMVQKTELLSRLYAAEDAAAMYTALVECELAALAGKKRLVPIDESAAQE